MKNKNFFSLFACLLILVPLTAQLSDPLPRRSVVTLEVTPEAYQQRRFSQNDIHFFKTEIDIPVSKKGAFIACSIAWELKSGDGVLKKLLYRQDGINYNLPLNHHIEKETDRFKSELAFIKREEERLSIRVITQGKPFLELKIHFFDPGQTMISFDQNQEIAPKASATCPCPQPVVIPRDDWCPSGDCPENASPTPTFVKHLIIHHAAGTNTASDWSAVVRSIWDYHVNTLGWSDIGYNWLIDTDGKIYEGRGKNILGAHFCGTNTGTMGICLLGNYTDITPAEETIQNLKEMLAWYCCEDEIDPLGISFHNSSGLQLDHISGHQDGCATQCPGNAFYPMIGELRNEVAAHIDLNCSLTASEDLEIGELLIYPNPNSGKFTIENGLKKPGQLTIYNSVGQRLINVNLRGDDQQTFDLSLYPKGIYFLKTEIADNRYMEKILIR